MTYGNASVWWYEQGTARVKDYKEVSVLTSAFDEKSLFIKHKRGSSIIKDWFFVETYDDP